LFETLDVQVKERVIFLHINLGIKATLAASIKDYILNEIPTLLRKNYQIDIYNNEFVNALYHDDLTYFEKSIYGELKGADPVGFGRERITFLEEKLAHKDEHLHASLGHLSRGRGHQIILILDNADQRTFETQQEAFLIAQELAATKNLLVFVALRPSTFFQSKLTGALSAYQNQVLTISPPPAAEVIEKRILFALRVAEGKIAPGTLSNIRLQLDSIVLFLTATLRSIRSNDKIRLFLGNITGGNTRLVIELITSFCGSPNVDSNKIVRIEEETGNYQVPLHEFTKHSLLGEYAYFHPESSLVACNIYDVSTAEPREHFLASLIIAFLIAPSAQKDHDGFLSGRAILSEMMSLNFSEDQVRYSLRRLAARRLIETPHAHYRELSVPETELPDQFYYRTTSIGAYHLKHWSGEFSFLDATSTDTPIFDESIRKPVFDNASSFEIKHRLQKAVDFRRYLETEWNLANITTTYLDFAGLLGLSDESFASVRKFLKKGQTPRKAGKGPKKR
jgi:hypothetical protein